MSPTKNHFEINGFIIVRSFLTEEQLAILSDAIGNLNLKPRAGGIREIDKLIPEVATFAKSEDMMFHASRYLSPNPKLVRAIYFDKNPVNNWLVSWHQDKTVTLSEKVEFNDWEPWSIKKGIHHVQPPIEVLENMITLRIHIDGATRENGCLKVIPGSHKHGLISTHDIPQYIKNKKIVFCEVIAGDAVVMRPHLLHSSEKAKVNDKRRVLHFEYSSYELPNGLSWHT